MSSKEFKQRFMPFHRLLYRVAYHLTSNQQDAEDLLQDLYLKLWVKRDELTEEQQTEAYLITMMRNLHRDQQRIRQLPIVDDPPPDEEPCSNRMSVVQQPADTLDPATQLEVKEATSRVNAIIEQLPDKQRTVARMHLMEDQSYDEIQQTTGLSNGNIRIIISRTKQTIIRLWKN